MTDERRVGATGRHDSDLAARDHMWRLLATLPPRQRAVLVLRYYDDLPDAQIAEVLGCSAVSVRVAAHRAMGTLRGALAPVAASVLTGVCRVVPATRHTRLSGLRLCDNWACPEPTGAAATTLR